MLRNFKINTALLICAAFMFRLLFVNIIVLSSSDAGQNAGCIKAKTSFLTPVKKDRYAEVLHSSKSSAYVLEEAYEEETNDDEQSKSNLFFLVAILDLLIAGETENSPEVFSFNKYFSNTSSCRYLIFQVFRV